MKRSIIRSTVVIALATVAAASFGLSFTTEQSGNYSISSASGVTYNNPFFVFASQSNPGGFLVNSGVLTVNQAAPASGPTGTPFTGSVTLVGPNAADTFTFSLTGTAYSGAAGTESISAYATLTGSTGAWAGYKVGTGNYSGQFVNTGVDANKNVVGTSYAAFSADVQAAPEPFGIAAVGLGIAGLIKRRKAA